MISNQKRLAARLKKINSNDLDLESLFNEIFQKSKEIPFRAGWFSNESEYVATNRICSADLERSGPGNERRESRLIAIPDRSTTAAKRGALYAGRGMVEPSRLSSHPIYQRVLKPNQLHFALILILLDTEKKCRGYITLGERRIKATLLRRILRY